jgi:hypothetical protein
MRRPCAAQPRTCDGKRAFGGGGVRAALGVAALRVWWRPHSPRVRPRRLDATCPWHLATVVWHATSQRRQRPRRRPDSSLALRQASPDFDRAGGDSLPSREPPVRLERRLELLTRALSVRMGRDDVHALLARGGGGGRDETPRGAAGVGRAFTSQDKVRSGVDWLLLGGGCVVSPEILEARRSTGAGEDVRTLTTCMYSDFV